MAPTLHCVTGADLAALFDRDPFLRWGPGPAATEVWTCGSVWALVVHRRRGDCAAPAGVPARLWAAGIPDTGARGPEAVGADLAHALRSLSDSGALSQHEVGSVSVPLAYAREAHRELPLADEGGDWDWMWTTDLPAVLPREDELVDLDDGLDADEINAFSAAHNPRVWASAGQGRASQWVGARATEAGPGWEPGDLLAVGGAEPEDSGVPHLSGIVTHRALRRSGLGSAISARLTRDGVLGSGVCTLGMYADNDAARRVYRRLGYRTAHLWHSRGIVAP